MRIASPPLDPPAHPDTAVPAAWQAEAAAARQSPWLASLLLRRLDSVREQLSELRAWLASLPRRMRRGWAKRWGRRLAQALPGAALLIALAAGDARAVTITVDPGGSGCTLADAIVAANTDLATGSCPAGIGPDMIGFAGVSMSYLLDTNYAGVPLPDITSVVTIQGNGNTTLDAEGAFRVLNVTGGGSLGLANATITGGRALDGGGIAVTASILNVTSTTISGNSASDDGGAIYGFNSTVSVTSATISGNTAGFDGGGVAVAVGALSVTSATISGNTAGQAGGGIWSRVASVSVTQSTVSGNTAGVHGGGIYVTDGMATVASSTISGNSAAQYGGGLCAVFNTVVLTNATVSGNSASDGGGGIASFGFSDVRLTHVTLTANSAAGFGGAIAIDDSAAVSSQNSIVAGQAAGDDCTGVPLNSGGYNIESGTSCGFTSTGDQQGVSTALLDLGPLAPNAPGGTQTHALGAGSAALNEIPPGTNGCGTAITSDQRGVARPLLGACDVGAYELQNLPTPTPTPTPTSTPAPPTAAELTLFAAAADPTGRVRITWETASEAGVAGFRVERAVARGPDGRAGPPEPAGPWTAVGHLVPARGSTAGGGRYVAVDAPGVGSFAYRLLVVNADGPPATQGSADVVVRALRAFLPIGWRGR